MEAIIGRIIGLEEQAARIVAEAREEESQILQQGEEEVKAISERIREMCDTKIAQLKGRTQYESDDRIIRIYEDTAMRMRLMEELAEQNQAGWEEDIFNRVTGK
jgi:F0F1-type ATP synthase membrane subunit b/b'